MSCTTNQQQQRRRRQSRSCAFHGFTLVELLVVVGIIGVLIAILLPSLQRARKQAVHLECMSNMRQQGIAIFMYVSDNRGEFPVGQLTDGNYNSSHVFQQHDILVDRYSGGNGRVWCCPEYTRFGFAPQSPAGWYNGAMVGGGYVHCMPCFYNAPPPQLMTADPNAYPGSYSAADQASPFFKNHLPLDPKLYMPSATQMWVTCNKPTKVRGRWMIRSEWYPAAPYDADWFAGMRHMNRNGLPEGGSILFTDGSVVWTPRVIFQGAWGFREAWPQTITYDGCY